MSRHATHSGDRQSFFALRQINFNCQLRSDVTLQARPCRRTSRRKFGIETFFGFAHLMFCSRLQPLKWPKVFARDFADFCQFVGAECRDPVGETSEKWRKPRVDNFEFAEQTLRRFFARVGADSCINIRAKNFGFFDRLVHRADDGVGDFALLFRGFVRFASTDVVFFELRLEASDIGAGSLHGVGKRAGRERFMDIGNRPTRQKCVCHGSQCIRCDICQVCSGTKL